jgi:broad specificity phosphatase PhoE
LILIRHGQTEFNRVFSVTRRDPIRPDRTASPSCFLCRTRARAGADR